MQGPPYFMRKLVAPDHSPCDQGDYDSPFFVSPGEYYARFLLFGSAV